MAAKIHTKFVERKDVLLFLGFYIVSTWIYYTASWISWGAFAPGHPPYFHFREFFASAGAQFIISFIVTVPIWYCIEILLKGRRLKQRLAAHILFLPLYVATCYYMLRWVVDFMGWALNWDGYNTVWTLYIFMLFYLVQFGFIHGYTYFKRFKIEEQEKAAIREAALKSEITALKSQLNPHFLHNLFNSINASIPPENERTRELIVQLSDLFRYQNYASQHEFVTVKEEIDFIKSYLELMKLRLKHRLSYSIAVPESLHDYPIAPMLLQPLVENAVTHGIAAKVEPSKLHLEIEKAGDRLRYTIKDTGSGIKDKHSLFSKGLGLSNTKLRLNKIYNSDLMIEDNYPSGTKISFTV